jgi:ABC-type bacteriocin/lantibiotic exporter with double-glycine peptidase domain
MRSYFSNLYRDSAHTLLWCIPLSIFQSLLLLPIPAIVRYVFDKVVPNSDFKRLLWCGGLMFVLYITDALLSLKIRTAIQRITKNATQNLRESLLWKLYSLPQSYHAHSDRSKIHTMITQDTERVDAMSNAVLTQFLPSLLSAIGFSIVLLFLSPFLFLVTILLLPLLFWISSLLNARVRKAVYSFHRSFEVFSKGVLFVLQNITLTSIQTAHKSEMERQGENLSRLKLNSTTMAFLRTAHFTVQNLVAGITMIVILITGGFAVLRGWMTIAQLLSFSVAIALWRNALSSAAQVIPQILEGNESLKTLDAFLWIGDTLPYSGRKQTEFEGNIRLHEISFSYSDQPFLHDIDLEISKGEVVAIIGPNGSGKTTITNLILGFYRPNEGFLSADNVPYDQLDLNHFRSFLGIVPQDPIPFHATIFENISYGNPSASLDQVQSAAKIAGADGFISNLQEKFQTVIGEHGMILSGGQRQLIAIARALLRNPQLLILDEPTKHLDQIAIRHLIRTLQTLRPAPSVLLISHEPDIIALADRVFTLHEGTLIPGPALHGIV